MFEHEETAFPDVIMRKLGKTKKVESKQFLREVGSVGQPPPTTPHSPEKQIFVTAAASLIANKNEMGKS